MRTVYFCMGLGLLAQGLSAQKIEYFPKENLKPGLRGITYTVLQGDKIEPVETEILGVAKDGIGPGNDMIIGRLIDPKTAVTGAVHGMSGSPLYIDGKMVGALSRRIAMFEKDGHCGFTPISDMLTVDRRVKQGVVAARQTPRVLPDLLKPVRAFFSEQPVSSTHLAIPLAVTGLREKWAEALFGGSGNIPALFQVVAGNASKVDAANIAEAGKKLQPGAPVAAVFMSGDVALAGTGTLTWREDNRILGFGHPMFGFGESAVPMATAEIVTTVPSYLRPYKMANVGPIVGTVSQDRLSAIGGIVGTLPAMGSYRVERTHNGEPRPALTGRFSAHPLLMPQIVGAALAAALLETDDASLKFSATVTGRLEFAGHPALELGGIYSGQDADVIMALMRMLEPVRLMYAQPWEEVAATSLALSIHTTEKQQVWGVESVQAGQKKVEPGSEVTVYVTLRERFGARTRQEFTLPVPESVKTGTFDVRVAGAEELDQAGQWPLLSTARDVDQLIRRLNQRRAGNRLYAQVLTQAPGQIVQAQEQPALPASVREVLSGANQTDKGVALTEKVWSETSAEIPGKVLGGGQLRFEIQ
jgi:hypothetical protein